MIKFRNWLEHQIPPEVYHGTPHEFTAFKVASSKNNDAGIWFSNSEKIARGYGYGGTWNNLILPKVIKAKITIKNPHIVYDRDVKITDKFIDRLKQEGYDGVIRILEYEEEYCVFDPSQIQVIKKT